MNLKFLGAAGTVTGSCYRLRGDKTQLLIDLGMFQGKAENQGLNTTLPEVDFRSIDAVLVTHAHLDHCGRLPLLVKNGYSGPIYMTGATKDLVELVLEDAAKLAKEGESRSVLYDEVDVAETMRLVKAIAYDENIDIGEFLIRFVDAGHILGSASIFIEQKKSKEKMVFSGDLGNSPEPIIAPTETVGEANVVVMESTYGDREHPDRDEAGVLAGVIQKAEQGQGVVLIPSFSLERTQELLFLFDQMKKSGKIKNETKVYLDSPMAIKATMIFKEFPNLYGERFKKRIKNDDPFDFPGLVICDKMSKSKRIKKTPNPKVIVAGSGMMSGGRIIYHAADYLSNPKTQLVFVGYQSQGTMGREIKDGAPRVNIMGKEIEVRARIVDIQSMSAHADQSQLLVWLKKIWGVKTVFLTHGEELPRLVLAEKIRQLIEGVKVELPLINQEVELK